MYDDLYKYAAVYEYLQEKESLDKLMAKLAWDQFQEDTTQKILRVAVPVGILGMAAYVCYYTYRIHANPEKKPEEPNPPKPINKRPPPQPKDIEIRDDSPATARNRVIKTMNKLNKEIVELNTKINNVEIELAKAEETVDSSFSAQLVSRIEEEQRKLLNKETQRKNLVALLDKLMHSEVDSVKSALSSLRCLSPTSGEERDAELKRELAEILSQNGVILN